MKRILTTILLSISITSFGQTTFYEPDGEKVKKVVGQRTTLIFNEEQVLPIPPKEGEEEGFAETLIASLLPGMIDLGFKISSDIIEKNLKKYTNEFSAKNTYMSTDSYVKSFKVNRYIMVEENSNLVEVFSLSVQPIPVDENTFVFAITGLSTNKSGAKSKKGNNICDYIVEIKLTYFDGREKQVQSSSPITMSLISIGNSEFKGENDNEFLYVSDKFPWNENYVVSEISAKIIETNSAKIGVERIKASYDKYSEDFKEGAKNILNFYIEKSKEENDDE